MYISLTYHIEEQRQKAQVEVFKNPELGDVRIKYIDLMSVLNKQNSKVTQNYCDWMWKQIQEGNSVEGFVLNKLY